MTKRSTGLPSRRQRRPSATRARIRLGRAGSSRSSRAATCRRCSYRGRRTASPGPWSLRVLPHARQEEVRQREPRVHGVGRSTAVNQLGGPTIGRSCGIRTGDRVRALVEPPMIPLRPSPPFVRRQVGRRPPAVRSSPTGPAMDIPAAKNTSSVRSPWSALRYGRPRCSRSGRSRRADRSAPR